MYRFKSLELSQDSILVLSTAQRIAAYVCLSSFVSLSAISHAQTEPSNTAAQTQQASATTASTTASTSTSATNKTAQAKSGNAVEKHDYGDNPNIFSVIGHKTQEKVVQGAAKAGEVTQKGISKIKPSVDQAWDVVTAKPVYKVPIEHKALSQSSTATAASTSSPVLTTPMSQAAQPVAEATAKAQPNTATTEASKLTPATQSQPMSKLTPARAPAPSQATDHPSSTKTPTTIKTTETPAQAETPVENQPKAQPQKSETPATTQTSTTTDLRHL